MKINLNDQNQCMKVFGKKQISVNQYITNENGKFAVIENSEGMLELYDVNDLYEGIYVHYDEPIKQVENNTTPNFVNQSPVQQQRPVQQAQRNDGMVHTEFMTFPESLRLPDLKGRKAYNAVRENTIGQGKASMPSIGIDYSVFGAPQLNEKPQQRPVQQNIQPQMQPQQPMIPQGFVLKGYYTVDGKPNTPCYTNPQWWKGGEKQADVWNQNGVYYMKPHQQQHNHNCGCGSSHHEDGHKCTCGHHHEKAPQTKEDALAKKYHISSRRIDELVKAGVLSDRLELKKAGKSEDEINETISKNIKAGKYRANAINELVKPAMISEEYDNAMREEHYKELTNVPADVKKALDEAEELAKKYNITEEKIQYVSNALEQAIRKECKGKFSDEEIEKDIQEHKAQGMYRINALQQCIDAAIKAEKKDEEEFQQVMQALMGGQQMQQQVQPQMAQQPQMQPQQMMYQQQMSQQPQLQQYQIVNMGGQQVLTYTDPTWWRQDVPPTSQEIAVMQGVYVMVPKYDYNQMMMGYQQGPVMYTGPYQEQPNPQKKSNIDWSKRITIERPPYDQQQNAICEEKKEVEQPQVNNVQTQQPQMTQAQPQYNVQQRPVQNSSNGDKLAYINNLLNNCTPETKQMVVNMLKQQGISIPGISNDELPDFSVFKDKNPNYSLRQCESGNVKVADPNFHPEELMGYNPLDLMANVSYADVDKMMGTQGSGVVIDNGIDMSYDQSRPVYKQQLVGQEVPFDPYDIKNNFGDIHNNVRRMMQENLYQNTANTMPMYAGQPLTANNAIYVGGGRYVPKSGRQMYNPMMVTQQAKQQQEEYQKKQIAEAEMYKNISRAVSHALGKEVDEERLNAIYDPSFVREKESQDKYWKDFEKKSNYERERDMRIRHCAQLSHMPSLQQIEEANRQRKLEEMARHQASFNGLSFFECIDKMNDEMAQEHYKKMNRQNFKANLRYLYDSQVYNDTFKGMQLDEGESYIEGTTIPMKYKDRYDRWCKAMDDEWGDLDG